MSKARAEQAGRVQEVLMRALPLSLLVCASWINSAGAGSLAVDATVVGGTCDVLINTSGVNQTSPGAAAPNLTLPQVMPTDLLQGLEPKNLTPVTVQVSNCSGTRGASGALPTLTVTGTTVTAPATPEGHLFRGGASTADERIGVVLATTEHPGAPSSAWGGYLAANSQVTLSQTAVNYNGAGVQGRANLWLGTSCGTAAQCSGAPSGPLTGGDVTAALTFAFSYQ